MKRRVLVLALAFSLILAMAASAFAVDLYAEGNAPILTFNGNTATCTASCCGNSSKDKIKATLTLYQGDTYVDSWSNSGTLQVFVSGSCKVKAVRAIG